MCDSLLVTYFSRKGINKRGRIDGNNLLNNILKGLHNFNTTDFLTNKKASKKEKEILSEYDQYNTNSCSINKSKISTKSNVLKNSIIFTTEKSLNDFKIEHKEK